VRIDIPPCIWLVAFAATINVTPAFSQQPQSPTHQVVSHIPRQPVESSAIAKIGYSKHLRILEIEFVNGAIYRYLDVLPAVYHDLLSAESKARFYDVNIKGHYRSIRVRAPQKQQVRAK
jgi:hypothetical protein